MEHLLAGLCFKYTNDKNQSQDSETVLAVQFFGAVKK
jgi:hypothetical protein